MSKVALIIDDLGSEKAKCIYLLSKILSLSHGDIKDSVGTDMPLFKKKIFDRNEPIFPYTLLNTLSTLSDLGCRWRAYELLDDEDYDKGKTYFEINHERLENMISMRNFSIEEQMQTGYLEDSSES